jgi:hypothetical protein
LRFIMALLVATAAGAAVGIFQARKVDSESIALEDKRVSSAEIKPVPHQLPADAKCEGFNCPNPFKQVGTADDSCKPSDVTLSTPPECTPSGQTLGDVSTHRPGLRDLNTKLDVYIRSWQLGNLEAGADLYSVYKECEDVVARIEKGVCEKIKPHALNAFKRIEELAKQGHPESAFHYMLMRSSPLLIKRSESEVAEERSLLQTAVNGGYAPASKIFERLFVE